MSAREYEGLGKAIQALDIDHCFRIVDGQVADAAPDDHAPDVFHDPDGDITVDAWRGEQWEAFTGMTGQYSYNGAVMHSSEYVGGAIAERIAEHAADYPDAVFALVVVNVMPEDGDDEPEPAGWAVVYRDVPVTA